MLRAAEFLSFRQKEYSARKLCMRTSHIMPLQSCPCGTATADFIIDDDGEQQRSLPQFQQPCPPATNFACGSARARPVREGARGLGNVLSEELRELECPRRDR